MAERRQLTRWQINRQAKAKLESAEAFADCMVNDINFKGLKVSLGPRLEPDKFLRMNMTLADDCCLDIECWVVWHKKVMETNVYGLYFSKIKDNDKERIYQFMRRYYPQEINKQWWKGLDEMKGGETMAKTDFQDKRIFARFPVNLPMKFVDLNVNKEGEATAHDISAKGFGFVAKEPLKPNTSLEMWLDVQDKGEPLYARGEVVWSKPAPNNTYRIGVNLGKADLMGLARLIRTP